MTAIYLTCGRGVAIGRPHRRAAPSVTPAVPAISPASTGPGAVAASAGGAGRSRDAPRVTFRSALAFALTALVGRAFDTTV